MVSSLSIHGQLSPIRVRPSSTRRDKYQIIFGSRRLSAARKLGWPKIKADIVEASEQEAMIMAFCENEDRKDLCDFEKAVFLEKIHNTTGMSYTQISDLIGKSVAYVSQHINMLHLLPDFVASDEEITRVLCALTESHARALSKIDNFHERWNTAKFAVSSKMSARELQKYCSQADVGRRSSERESKELIIRKIITDIIAGFNSRDVRPYIDSLSERYFNTFVVLPQFKKMDAERAKEYVLKVLTRVESFKETLEDLDVKMVGNLAIATLDVLTETVYLGKYSATKFRATIIFERGQNWKIIHEHWSADDPKKLFSLFNRHDDLEGPSEFESPKAQRTNSNRKLFS